MKVLNHSVRFLLMLVRDKQKAEACARAGISLIQIPYWWDEREETLAACIHHIRPDIMPDSRGGRLIPTKPPSKKNKKKISV